MLLQRGYLEIQRKRAFIQDRLSTEALGVVKRCSIALSSRYGMTTQGGMTTQDVTICNMAKVLRPVGYTQFPFRISGSAEPSACRPSTFTAGPPIIQSTWIRLSFAPRFASSSFDIFAPPVRQVEYA